MQQWQMCSAPTLQNHGGNFGESLHLRITLAACHLSTINGGNWKIRLTSPYPKRSAYTLPSKNRHPPHKAQSSNRLEAEEWRGYSQLAICFPHLIEQTANQNCVCVLEA